MFLFIAYAYPFSILGTPWNVHFASLFGIPGYGDLYDAIEIIHNYATPADKMACVIIINLEVIFRGVV